MLLETVVILKCWEIARNISTTAITHHINSVHVLLIESVRVKSVLRPNATTVWPNTGSSNLSATWEVILTFPIFHERVSVNRSDLSANQRSEGLPPHFPLLELQADGRGLKSVSVWNCNFDVDSVCVEIGGHSPSLLRNFQFHYSYSWRGSKARSCNQHEMDRRWKDSISPWKAAKQRGMYHA